MTDKKILSCTQAVEAATVLLEINTRRNEVANMAEHAALPHEASDIQNIYFEWLAFTHAAIVYSLMHRAPASVVAAYLRTTTELLQHYAPHEAPTMTSGPNNGANTGVNHTVSHFVDAVFSPYMECLAQERHKDCPAIFIQRVCGQTLQEASATTVRVISGVMAMAVCSILDALSQYDIQVD